MVLVAGLLVFAAATAGLALLVEPIPTWYYHLAWWSYILAADDLNHRISGSSLMRDHPRRFLWLGLQASSAREAAAIGNKPSCGFGKMGRADR